MELSSPMFAGHRGCSPSFPHSVQSSVSSGHDPAFSPRAPTPLLFLCPIKKPVAPACEQHGPPSALGTSWLDENSSNPGNVGSATESKGGILGHGSCGTSCS